MSSRLAFLSVIVLPLALALSACGDPKSPREILQTRNREQINQRLAELEPLTGEYEGKLREERSGMETPIRLNIVLSGEAYEGAGIPEETAMPALSASVTVYTLETRSERSTPIAFGRSDYDSVSGRLKFFRDRDASLRITVSPDRSTLWGRWDDAIRGRIGDFEVRKVR
ncbi:MAG: hypothetical protein NDJ89_17485 [Oligoflexia bacterium]|nr:hypothetical protein [Oligoflexia bacterium]